MKTKRACIYPHDIQRITGKTLRASQELLQKIKQHYEKDKQHFLTIDEFCQYTKLDKNLVESYLAD